MKRLLGAVFSVYCVEKFTLFVRSILVHNTSSGFPLISLGVFLRFSSSIWKFYVFMV